MANQTKKVVIYSTPSCTYCRLAKDFFKLHNVAFTEYNVGADAERREEMMTKSGQMGVPVIIITNEDGDEEVIVGFDKSTIVASLGL